MATSADSTPHSRPSAVRRRVHILNRIGLEDAFLALQASRERLTARLYELFDILMPERRAPVTV